MLNPNQMVEWTLKNITLQSLSSPGFVLYVFLWFLVIILPYSLHLSLLPSSGIHSPGTHRTSRHKDRHFAALQKWGVKYCAPSKQKKYVELKQKKIGRNYSRESDTTIKFPEMEN